MVYLTESMQDNFNNRSVIYEFNRTYNGKKYINKITNFQPYFFVKENVKVKDSRVIKEVKGFIGLGNVKLKKCITKISSDIKSIKEQLESDGIKTWEADIMFHNRYLIDKHTLIQKVKLKTFSLDIETNYTNIAPDFENPTQEITCIGIQDSFTNNKYVFTWRKDFKNTTEKSLNYTVFKYSTEETMLNEFANFIHEESPDIITGWNVVSFDMYYIIIRMQFLELNFRKLSPINSVSVYEKYHDVTIKGIVLFDMLVYYKFFRKISNQTELVNYKLDTVAKELLGSEKLVYDNTLSHLWKNDIDTLIEYNIKDVELVLDLDKKLQIIDFFDELRITAHCQFDNLNKTTMLIDSYIMSKYRDIKLPSKIKIKKTSKYAGAYVFTPIPGLHKNIIYLDLASLYPSIMRTFNISPDTFNPKSGEIRVSDEIAFDKTEGMIPKILKELKTERDNYKKIKAYSKVKSSEWTIAHYRQYAIKVIMNAMYGYLGTLNSRFYIKELAETITMMGRKILLWSKNVSEKDNFKVIYGDTDSILLVPLEKNITEIQLIKEGNRIKDKINDTYDSFAKKYNIDDHCIEMEFEKALKNILFTCDNSGKGVKKRYAYKKLWEDKKFIHDNKLYITGFDLVRSDNSRITKEVQKEVLQQILDGKSHEEVFEYLMTIKKRILSGDITVEQLAFPVPFKEQLNNYGQVTPALKGAIYSNRYLGTNLEKGGKYLWLPIKRAPQGMPQYVKVEYLKRNALTKKKDRTKQNFILNAITFDEELDDRFRKVIDIEYLENRTITMKLEHIFKSIGWEWQPLCKNNQCTLI